MLARFIVVCALLLTTGCGLFGMAIGAAVPRYSDQRALGVGDDVRVETEAGDALSGRLVTSDPTRVVVLSAGAPRDVPRWQIKSIEQRVGSHWKTGLEIGVAIDVICTVALTALLIGAATWHPVSLGGW